LTYFPSSHFRSAQYEIERHAHELAKITALNHPHINGLVGTIQTNNEWWMISQWCDGGTLFDLWQRNLVPTISGNLIREILHQLDGLADATRVLHKNEIRLGNLQPGKILSLKKQNNNEIGELRFDCVSYSIRKHHQVTTMRYATRTGSLTTIYDAPGIRKMEPRTRYSDIWSMGCIILEFMIWILYGPAKLEKFREEFKYRPYDFTADERVAFQSDNVKIWIERISQDPRCKEGTALGDLLKLVNTKLLVAAIPPREEVSVVRAPDLEVASSQDQFTFSISVSDPSVPDPSPPSTAATETQYRADAEELHKELHRIAQKADSDSNYLFTSTVPETPNAPEPAA